MFVVVAMKNQMGCRVWEHMLRKVGHRGEAKKGDNNAEFPLLGSNPPSSRPQAWGTFHAQFQEQGVAFLSTNRADYPEIDTQNSRPV